MAGCRGTGIAESAQCPGGATPVSQPTRDDWEEDAIMSDRINQNRDRIEGSVDEVQGKGK